MGLSYGAHLVARLLGRLGDRARRAVPINGFVVLPEEVRASRAEMAEALRQGVLPWSRMVELATGVFVGERHRISQAEARTRELLDRMPIERFLRSAERIVRLGTDDAVPAYDVPCTVVHAAEDSALPVDCSRDLAARGSRAELVELDRDSHLLSFTSRGSKRAGCEWTGRAARGISFT